MLRAVGEVGRQPGGHVGVAAVPAGQQRIEDSRGGGCPPTICHTRSSSGSVELVQGRQRPGQFHGFGLGESGPIGWNDSTRSAWPGSTNGYRLVISSRH